MANVTDINDACITCADNGEVLITGEEAQTMFNALKTLNRIFDQAPYKNGDETCGCKELAVKFKNKMDVDF